MTKNTKKFLLFLALLAIFTIARFPYQHFGKSIYHKIQSQLAKESILLSAKEAKLSFPALLKFSQAQLSFPQLGLRFPETKSSKLNIEEAHFQLKVLPLFLLRQELSARFQSLGGLASFLLSKRFTNEHHKLDFFIQGIALDLLPSPLEGGISGTFNLEGTLTGDAALGGGLQSFLDGEKAQLKLNVTDANYYGGDKISGIIKLPPIENIKVDAEAHLKEGGISIDYFSAFTSLGAAKGSGMLRLLESGRIGQAEMKIEIDLTDEGARSFSGYLALAANISPETNYKNWTLLLEKSPNQALPVVKAAVRQ